MNTREAMKRAFVTEAIWPESHWGYDGRHKHRITTFNVERYIWRTEDVPLYRVAVPEALGIALTHILPGEMLATKILEYVPTGRIRYDNSAPDMLASLEEMEHAYLEGSDSEYGNAIMRMRAALAKAKGLASPGEEREP